MLLKTKMELLESSFASSLQQFQQSLQAINDRLDKIEKRLDNMGVAAGHVLTVTISFSQDKSNLYKTVVVTGSATDSLGHTLNRAALWVDDKLVAEKTASPWTWDLNTTRYANGAHIVKVGFWCASGGYGEKSESVTINNAVSTGGASTSYTPTGGGGQQYEQQGCQIIIYDVTPLSGSTVSEEELVVWFKVKDSMNHPITSVKFNTPYASNSNATQASGYENTWRFRLFYVDASGNPASSVTATITATCAAGNTGSMTVTYYKPGGGGGGAGGRQPT
jgi:hypothetical protein